MFHIQTIKESNNEYQLHPGFTFTDHEKASDFVCTSEVLKSMENIGIDNSSCSSDPSIDDKNWDIFGEGANKQ